MIHPESPDCVREAGAARQCASIRREAASFNNELKQTTPRTCAVSLRHAACSSSSFVSRRRARSACPAAFSPHIALALLTLPALILRSGNIRNARPIFGSTSQSCAALAAPLLASAVLRCTPRASAPLRNCSGAAAERWRYLDAGQGHYDLDASTYRRGYLLCSWQLHFCQTS